MIKELIFIAISAALLNNVVLSQFLGLCSFLGVSTNTRTAAGMGSAVCFVITIASAVANLLYYQILVRFHLEYLQTIVFILVIAALVQVVEMFLKNCAVLGVALKNVLNKYNMAQSVVCGFGTALGYTISIIILAGIRERIADNDIPENLQGAPIVLITAALMSIAFMGFSDLKF